MARKMREFNNCDVVAGNITVRLLGGITKYHATGWVVRNGNDLKIYAEDQRRTEPLMVVPMDVVKSIDVDLLN